jgi:hypothetical protein
MSASSYSEPHRRRLTSHRLIEEHASCTGIARSVLMGEDVAFSPMWATTKGYKARTVVASATG